MPIGLNSRGLDTHEMVVASDLMESLGVSVTAVCFGALRRISSGRRCILGQELEKVVRHDTCVLLLNRLSLSVLNHSYGVIHAHYDESVPWVSLCQELQRLGQLLVLARTDPTGEWDTRVMISDACLTGFAVCETDCPACDVGNVGRWHER